MMQVGKAIGMVTLNDALMDLVTRKLITPEEGYLKAIDKPGMDLTMKRAGIDPSKFAPSRRSRQRRQRPGRRPTARSSGRPAHLSSSPGSSGCTF